MAGALVGVAIAAGVAWIVLTSSPTPGALLIRAELDAQSAKTKTKMAGYVTRVGVGELTVLRDQAYRAGDPEALLDVYFPSGEPREPNPTIVWMHGGGWLAGDKADWAPYFELLADRGFTVVSVGYALAPEHTYPRAVVEVNAALGYLERHAARLRIDPDRLILAGDSAGAQLASQVAALTTNPAYARELRITPTIDAGQLAGVILHCGVYDATPFVDQDVSPGGPVGFGVATLLWAYAGTKDWDSPIFRQMSTLDDVTAAFPPAFITGGNADPLTDGQSRRLAARLQRLGVPVETAFFPADRRPKLEHEFQFDLATGAAQDVFARTVAFVRERAAGVPSANRSG